ncbi:MAG: hypothetical protein Q7R56_03260 [Nanoarchaeota archaeon]|nr:hypothetical protein [Nanoarchaeota archaeon]
MDIATIYAIILSVVTVSFIQIGIGVVVGYAVFYVLFRLFGRRLSIKNYIKLMFSIGLDIADFFVVFQGFDFIWEGVLGLVGILFWGGKRGWLQFHELFPYPVDGFVPSLTISGFWYILSGEKNHARLRSTDDSDE